jgi:hypothetical protein
MNSFLDLVRNPFFAMLLIVFGPLAIALIYRGWHGTDRANAIERALRSGAIDDVFPANQSSTRPGDLQNQRAMKT